MKKIIFVDIDGTVANLEHRLHFIKGEDRDYNSFFLSCKDDSPIVEIIDLVRNLYLSNKYRIIFCTGRSEICRTQTQSWLETHFRIQFPDFVLLMRGKGDVRPDTIVKFQLVKKFLDYIEEDLSSIDFILEDRDSVVQMWRGHNVKCLQVADGKF